MNPGRFTKVNFHQDRKISILKRSGSNFALVIVTSKCDIGTIVKKTFVSVNETNDFPCRQK